MKKTILGLVISILSFAATAFGADNMTPPGPPGSDEAKMKTLNEIEPRKIISQLPFFITESGAYYLGSSLVGKPDSNGIEVAASDVQIDLSGFALTGISNSWHGIAVTAPVDNITIRNGVIRNWGRHGINASNSASVAVSEVIISKSGWGGVYVGKNAMIERCTITGGGWNVPPPGPPPQDDAPRAEAVDIFEPPQGMHIRTFSGTTLVVKDHAEVQICRPDEHNETCAFVNEWLKNIRVLDKDVLIGEQYSLGMVNMVDGASQK